MYLALDLVITQVTKQGTGITPLLLALLTIADIFMQITDLSSNHTGTTSTKQSMLISIWNGTMFCKFLPLPNLKMHPAQYV